MFDYKNGEDYTCKLCGENYHTSRPRPDKLCDGCWELKIRVKMQPALARKVLADMGITHKQLLAMQLLRLIEQHNEDCNIPDCGISVSSFRLVYEEWVGRKCTKEEASHFM